MVGYNRWGIWSVERTSYGWTLVWEFGFILLAPPEFTYLQAVDVATDFMFEFVHGNPMPIHELEGLVLARSRISI